LGWSLSGGFSRAFFFMALERARQAGTWPPRSGRSSRAVGELSIHQLGVAGDIETIRGRGGGVRLARPPETINVGAVVRRTEDLALVTCLEGRACLIASACMLQTALKEALRHSSPSPRPLYDCRSCLLAVAAAGCKKPPIAD
jgi:Iron-dependent Transcriptional regulator